MIRVESALQFEDEYFYDESPCHFVNSSGDTVSGVLCIRRSLSDTSTPSINIDKSTLFHGDIYHFSKIKYDKVALAPTIFLEDKRSINLSNTYHHAYVIHTDSDYIHMNDYVEIKTCDHYYIGRIYDIYSSNRGEYIYNYNDSAIALDCSKPNHLERYTIDLCVIESISKLSEDALECLKKQE